MRTVVFLMPLSAVGLTALFLGMSASAMPSDRTIGELADGIDMTRIPGTPGLHVVPLEQSPFVGLLRQKIKRELAEQEASGATTAQRGEVPDIRKAAQAHARSRRGDLSERPDQPLESIRSHLRYEPISVKGTILEKIRLVEATTGGGVLDGRWTGLSRAWEVPGLGYVQLEEYEYRESGGSITLVKEWVNADVNGNPGSIQTKREPDGKAIVSLHWVTDSTIFHLDLQPLHPDALSTNQEALLTLARSLGR